MAQKRSTSSGRSAAGDRGADRECALYRRRVFSRWLLLRWINPPVTAFMAEAQVAAWMSRDSNYVFRHSWVDLDRISPNLPLAVVASEDQKFPEHWGFDVEAIEKAYALNQHSHRVHGASTISQQVAKNLFLWSGRSYFRKGLEAYFTLLIEGPMAEAADIGSVFEYRRIRLRLNLWRGKPKPPRNDSTSTN